MKSVLASCRRHSCLLYRRLSSRQRVRTAAGAQVGKPATQHTRMSAARSWMVLAFIFAFALSAPSVDKKIVFIAGNPSHGAGEHEYRAGCLLLQKCLKTIPGISTSVHSNDWPKSSDALDRADAIIIFSSGGGGHPAIKDNRLQMLGELMKKGIGLGCIHYAVELPKEKGGPEFLQWIGGYFETYWSVNPHWTADFKELPNHPITRGVKPFKIHDEWYYHMRFPEGMKNVT